MLLLGTGPCSIVVRCKQSGQVIIRNTVLLLLSTLTCFGLHRCLDSGLGTRCVAASCCTRQGALISWLLATTGSVPRLDAPIELRGMPAVVLENRQGRACSKSKRLWIDRTCCRAASTLSLAPAADEGATESEERGEALVTAEEEDAAADDDEEGALRLTSCAC